MGMRITWLLLFLLALTGPVLTAQEHRPSETREEYESEYQERIKKETLYGVYIPQDLTDAFIQLNKLIEADDRQKFKSLSEEEAEHRLFFSLGRWIIHNWGFYGGSRLSHFLRELGVYHPEDMARFIIITYHRNLNRKSLDVKPLVESIQEKRLQEQQEKRKDGQILHEETRVREKTEDQRD